MFGFMQMHWAGFSLLLVKLRYGCVYPSSGLVAPLTLLLLNMPLAQHFESLRHCIQNKTCPLWQSVPLETLVLPQRGERWATRQPLCHAEQCPSPSFPRSQGSLQATFRQRTSAWHADVYQPRGRGVHWQNKPAQQGRTTPSVKSGRWTRYQTGESGVLADNRDTEQ